MRYSTRNYVKHIIHVNCSFSQAWPLKTETRSRMKDTLGKCRGEPAFDWPFNN